MDNVISLALTVDQRLERLYTKLVSSGLSAANVQQKVIRAIGLLVNSAAGPKVQLCQLQDNKDSSGVSFPTQQLLAQTSAFAFSGMRVAVAKAATAAALRSARKFTYADITTFPLAGNENASVQSLYNAGLISMSIGSDVYMQPLALSYFENEANPQSAAAVVAVNPTYNNRYQLLKEDVAIVGGNQNFFSFDLTGADTSAISPAGANYVVVELTGFEILDGNNDINAKAVLQNVCG